jgi:hypothetical protein
MNTSFRTTIKVNRSSFTIDYNTSTFLMGSCFSDSVGELLNYYKLPVLLNPFGVLYNPASIAQALNTIISNKTIQTDDLFQKDDLWHSFDFHGSFSDTNKNLVLKNTNSAIQNAHNYLIKSNCIIITLGTAWVYEYIKTNKIVANCHKFHANEFKRYKLTVNTIIESWNATIEKLKSFNPTIKIIFTISPVRHLKDGAHENQLSKASLLLAVDELIQQNKNCCYFPSYEIVQDELRDYRFYADDMIHISEKAVNYIFEKFKSVYISEKTKKTMNEVEVIAKGYSHRILSNNKTEIQKFAISMLNKIKIFEENNSNVKFELEKNYFKNLYQPIRLL